MSTPTDLTPRVEALEGDDVTLQGLATGLEGRVSTLETSTSDIGARVDTLETNYAALLDRVNAIEKRVAALETAAGITPPSDTGTAPTNVAPPDGSNTFTS
jgi:chromosome segregation ATPase